MKEVIDEILKEEKFYKIIRDLSSHLLTMELTEEASFLDILEFDCLPNYIKLKQYNNFRAEEIILWIEKEREDIRERLIKMKTMDGKFGLTPTTRHREINEDMSFKAFSILSDQITDEYFINHVEKYKVNLSEIGFANKELKHKEQRILIETEYNNFNALRFYNYYKKIILNYIQSKELK
jgi:hypothetical protein